MDNEFKEFLDKFKEEEINSEETKEYILKIKKYLDAFIKNSEGELTEEECLEQFLEKYEEELKPRKTTTRRLMYGVSQYNSCKMLLNLYKANKMKFNNLVKNSRQKEKSSKNEILYNSLKTEEQLEITLRTVFRRYPKATEKEILTELKKDKSYFEEMLKEEFIKRIEDSILYLNEYGTLDELIDLTNRQLESLNLKDITLIKRNPLPDEIYDENRNVIKYDEKGKLCKYDKNGNIILDGDNLEKYKEDLGVLEILDREYLKNLSVENLLLLDAFWKAKQLEERGKISKAMITIELGNLWSSIIYGTEKQIENLDDNIIINNLKRDKALTYLIGNENDITLKMKRQYTKFLKDNNLSKKGKLEDEIKIEKVELDNLVAISSDLALESCVIVGKLKDREFSDVKNWGVFNEYDYGNERKEIQVLIENPVFRSPLFMGIPDNILSSYMGTTKIELPKFKGIEKVDNAYNDIMSEMYLPSTDYFKDCMMKKYFDNPSSELFARLAGKKVKTVNKDVREL